MIWQPRPERMLDAACRGLDPEMFFPTRGRHGNQVLDAKRVCAGCPVCSDCLTFALDDDNLGGIWGGLTWRQRREWRRTHRRAA